MGKSHSGLGAGGPHMSVLWCSVTTDVSRQADEFKLTTSEKLCHAAPMCNTNPIGMILAPPVGQEFYKRWLRNIQCDDDGHHITYIKPGKSSPPPPQLLPYSWCQLFEERHTVLYWESLNGQLPLLTWSLSPIYTFVADTFEMVADRNYVMVDTFNRRLEVSATWRNFYWRWCRHSGVT